MEKRNKNLVKEVWRDTDVEGYQVSNHGRVRSLDSLIHYSNGQYRKRFGRILKLRPDKDGYSIVTLSYKSVLYHKKVHRLVAEAFCDRSKGIEVNHLNEVKSDNYYKNLEWVSRKQNMAYSKGNNAKTLLQFSLSGELIKKWPSLTSCREGGFNPTSVSQCCNGHTKTSKGYKWEYIK